MSIVRDSEKLCDYEMKMNVGDFESVFSPVTWIVTLQCLQCRDHGYTTPMAHDGVTNRVEGAARGRVSKANLPCKTCAACLRPMRWRRAWAKTWNEVRYCSDACRKRRGRDGARDGEPR
jgi:hypothetical protein